MAWRLGILVLVLNALVCVGGCAIAEPGTGHKSPLEQAKASPDSVTLEVFLATLPCDHKAYDDLWNEIDEQRFPAELRRELARNGFRAGLVGSHMPMELTRLLALSDKPVPKDAPTDVNADDPRVSLRVLQLRAGHPAEIQPVEHVYDELPLLTREDGALVGRPYYKAECRLALRAFPEPDGKIRVELTPELEHGEQHQRWIGNDGVMRLDAAKPKKTFDLLALSARLAAGEVLVMTSLPERPGSLGHYFFSQTNMNEQAMRKLLVIRAAQSGPDAHFKEEEPKTIDVNVQ